LANRKWDISKQYADHTPWPGIEESLAAAEGLYWGTGQISPLTLYQAPFAQHGEASLTDRSLVEEKEIGVAAVARGRALCQEHPGPVQVKGSLQRTSSQGNSPWSILGKTCIRWLILATSCGVFFLLTRTINWP